MLKTEFIERTGFKPTDDYYHTVIEPEYEKSDIDKDAWCKQWKKNGGIQKAYDAMCEEAANEYGRTLSLEADIKILKEERETLMQERREKIEERVDMAFFLIEQAQKWSASDLREKAIEMIGERAYIRYKLEHDMKLWEADRQLILENLK